MKRVKYLFVVLCLCASATTLTSCNDKIEVQQVYDFTMSTMPVPSELEIGETVELRCEIIKSGYYEQAQLTIRYFQTSGDGELSTDDGTVFKPNDRYILDKDKFRFYYTSHCNEQQRIDIYIEDNFGGEQKQTLNGQVNKKMNVIELNNT